MRAKTVFNRIKKMDGSEFDVDFEHPDINKFFGKYTLKPGELHDLHKKWPDVKDSFWPEGLSSHPFIYWVQWFGDDGAMSDCRKIYRNFFMEVDSIPSSSNWSDEIYEKAEHLSRGFHLSKRSTKRLPPLMNAYENNNKNMPMKDTYRSWSFNSDFAEEYSMKDDRDPIGGFNYYSIVLGFKPNRVFANLHEVGGNGSVGEIISLPGEYMYDIEKFEYIENPYN